MNINTLIRTTQKPEVYSPGTSEMWRDEYISSQLLATHLIQETDLASRKESTIKTTVQWILGQVPGDGLNILDLGCGPGLYTVKYAEAGHHVTGIDFSMSSIDYAKASAAKNDLSINYHTLDYLQLDEVDKYDLITLIYTDLGVLNPNQRATLLGNIYRALKPGGVVIFDVLNERAKDHLLTPRSWEVTGKGFWRDSPCLALSESYYYEEQKVTLNQHIVVDDKGDLEVYRFWIHTFSDRDLEKICSASGLKLGLTNNTVIPASDLAPLGAVTFCMASKV